MLRRVLFASVLGSALLLAANAGAESRSTGGRKAAAKNKTATVAKKKPASRATKTARSSLSGTRSAPGRRLRAAANGLEVAASENALVNLAASWKKSAPSDPRSFGRLEVVITDAGRSARGNRNTGAAPAELSVALRGLSTRHLQFTGGTGQSANSITYPFGARRVTSKVDRDDTRLEIAQKLASQINTLRRQDGVAYYSAQAKVIKGKVTLTIWPGGAFE